MTTVCLPVLQTRLFGWPVMVRMSDAEKLALVKAHLGGLEALRTAEYRCSCRTVDSLVTKGLLGRDGLTPLGDYLAQGFARP